MIVTILYFLPAAGAELDVFVMAANRMVPLNLYLRAIVGFPADITQTRLSMRSMGPCMLCLLYIWSIHQY